MRMLNVMLGLPLLLNGCLTIGCAGLLPGQRLEQALGQAAEALGQKIVDEGVLKDWLIDADGHVQDPGLATGVCVDIRTYVRAIGVNGNLVSKASGDSTRLPAGLRDELIKQLSGPISDEQRAGILAILGWNRTPAGGTAAPPNP